MVFSRSFVSWLLALLALMPLSLIAFAGLFSRMKIDDFLVVATAQRYDAWGTMLFHFNYGSGSYARFFLIGALGPLDHMATAVAPLLIVTLWFCALCWLLYEALHCLGVKSSRGPAIAALSALTVSAAIAAFPSERAIYWYVANTAYALPFAPLSAFMALCIRAARRGAVSRKALLAGAIICFLAAGLAEAFVIFQLCFLGICLLLAIFALDGAKRIACAGTLGAGLAASLASLVLQLHSPGVMKRNLAVSQDALIPPVRSLPDLITGTVENSFAFLSGPEITSGFLLLTAVGMLFALTRDDLPTLQPEARPARLFVPLLWLGLIFQFICMPILWSYVSEDPQVLGRFSFRYSPFVLLNIVLIVVYALLLWGQKSVNARLSGHGPGLRATFDVLLIIVSTLLALEISAVRIYAWFYLLCAFTLFLASFVWESPAAAAIVSPRQGSFLLILCLTITWLGGASVAATLLFARGEVFIRTMTPGTTLMTVSGLVWGIYLGYRVKGYLGVSRFKYPWDFLVKLGLLATILLMGTAMVRDQIALVQLYQSHARQWDANHAKILEMRDSGESPIIVDPMPRSFGNYMTERDAVFYYGVPVTVNEER